MEKTRLSINTYMYFRLFVEGKLQDIANLQPDTVLTVFHGTDSTTVFNFCTKGIDAKQSQRYRVYTHTSGTKPIKFGIFVTLNLNTAFKFGSAAVKFKCLGKDLIYQDPVGMVKKHKDWQKENYPKSFRPLVSYDLLSDGPEPQAIFIGLISPRAIEKVYTYNKPPMSREEYIKYYTKEDNSSQTALFEPQEYKMDLKDFVKRTAQRHNSSEEEILEILKRVYKQAGHLTGVGEIPYSLKRRIEAQLRNIIKQEQI